MKNLKNVFMGIFRFFTGIVLSFGILFFSSCRNPLDSENTERIRGLNIMTINIRSDTPDDGENRWQNRKDVVGQIIRDENIDIVGTQEVNPAQLKDLERQLFDYRYIGVGCIDGVNEGNFCAIFYKTNRFNVIYSGTFWLSETPEIPGSKGWDSISVRIATWAILEEVLNQQKIFVLNTHLDSSGTIARKESVKLLMNKISTLYNNLPIIITGDFNMTPDDPDIKQMYNTDYSYQLIHARDIAELKDNTIGTFHDFGRIPLEKRSFIDYIFVSKEIKVLKHVVLPDKLGDIFISDHAPVVSNILLGY
jgi:endonuclease/exonuclease/phosphatase family metal-dependent hydrolase